MEISIQDKYGPNGICFGCGPKNDSGLKIKTYYIDDHYQLKFETNETHRAFQGAINGGIIGTLFDCHGNWAAAYEIFTKYELKEFPSTVTAYFNVTLKKPTPSDKLLYIEANITESSMRKAKVNMIMYILKGEERIITAECDALYVLIEENHPAYHRWE